MPSSTGTALACASAHLDARPKCTAKPRAVSYFSPHSLQPSVKALPHIFRLFATSWSNITVQPGENETGRCAREMHGRLFASRRVWNNILIMFCLYIFIFWVHFLLPD